MFQIFSSISSEELLNVAPNLVINLLVCFDNAAQSRLWVFLFHFVSFVVFGVLINFAVDRGLAFSKTREPFTTRINCFPPLKKSWHDWAYTYHISMKKTWDNFD